MVEVVQDVDFAWPSRVYYEDTDGQGYLYHSRCMNFFERARTEWVRSLGVTQSEWLAKGLGFVVSKAELNYHKPAFLDDALVATVKVLKAGRTRITLAQQLLKPHLEPQGAPLEQISWAGGATKDFSFLANAATSCIVSGEFSIAFIELEKGKPLAMPPQMAQALIK